jgi:16S rRNA U516 pseudouridylate synthase RsuA-like enzyme
MAAAVRLNRYLAAAGLGTRREVEGLIVQGRVLIDGTVCIDPARRVILGEDVTVDGAELGGGPTGVVLHRAAGAPCELVHPGALHPVLALPQSAGGLELLLADVDLARRLSDPRFPLRVRTAAGGLRDRLGDLTLEGLAPGQWRPVAPRELERLRRGARLPPRSG